MSDAINDFHFVCSNSLIYQRENKDYPVNTLEITMNKI